MYGALYKYFNVKWCYLAAIFVFEIGSLLSAVAPSSKALIVGRAVAGVSPFFEKTPLFAFFCYFALFGLGEC